jgi:hypothetical protein
MLVAHITKPAYDKNRKRENRQMKKALAIMIMVTLTLSLYSLAIPASASDTALPDYQPVDWRSGLAGQLYVPTLQDETDMQEVSSFITTPPVGTQAWDWYLRSISRNTPTGNQPYMTLRAVSGNVEIWTQDYLWFFPGDPRNTDPYNLMITDEMCQYFADEFNNVIYPTDTQYFGKPLDRNGSYNLFEAINANYPSPAPGSPSEWWNWIHTDNPQRVIVKVLNIRDANYNDPNYPYYVVGFYSPTYTISYYDRNMIQIDAWRWWQRLGPEGKQWFPDTRPDLIVNRPHVYESTTAHEYQHLIHQDMSPADDLFMNEGCSMYAEYLCGYGIEANYFNSYFATPDNSLTVWGDQGDINILADYGAAALWTMYLSDHYGGAPLISYFVQSGVGGIEGINAALSHFGYKTTFDRVYHDWRIANLVRSDFPGRGIYNYKSIDLNDPEIIPVRIYDTSGMPVPLTRGTDFGTTMTILGYDTGVSKIAPYGTDYIKFQDWRKAGIVHFDGDDVAFGYGWNWFADSGGYWYSGSADLYDALLFGQAYVNPADPTLTLVTAYGVETFWDFGFVQVSTDSGVTWTSVANEYTTSDYDPSAHPNIIANLPGLTDYNPDWPDWTTMTFDLTPYAGMNVLIGFRYMTDWATTFEGWFIQSAMVSGQSLTLTPVYPEIDHFQVTLVYALPTRHDTIFVPMDMWLRDTTKAGSTLALANKPSYIIMIVTPVMSAGLADYQFSVTSILRSMCLWLCL